MLEVLAIIILVVWALGIVVLGLAVKMILNDPDNELNVQLQTAIDMGGRGPILSVLTVLVVFWPAALAYNAIKSNKE